jgi:hypothetical protein
VILAELLTRIHYREITSTDTTKFAPLYSVLSLLSYMLGVTRGQGTGIEVVQTTNLIVGSIVGQAASHSIDMTL